MPRTAPSLSIAQLKEVFGCSHVTIFNWGKTIDFPSVGERTAGNIKRWAKANGKEIAREPLDVLNGRKSKKADAAVKRSATSALRTPRAKARRKVAH